jgi:hypothetical protein
MLRSIPGIGKLLQGPGLAEDTAAHNLTFETYGLRVRVVADSPETLARIPPLLPPGWRRSDATAVDTTYMFTPGPGDTCLLTQDGKTILDDWRLDVALAVFERELRLFVALEAPALIFVHAGVVAYRGHAILMPGKTYAGKTSLVAALVRAGATYYSDEFAPLDEHGRVHPFAKPLSLRKGGGQIDHDVESLGGVAGTEPAPVGMVVATTYRPGSHWQPIQLSAGEAVLALLDDTIPAQTRPAECIRALTAAAERALVVQGERDEAGDLAPVLLAALENGLTTRMP